MEGIRDCKAFILVLSPDSMESRYVREEVHKALELGKTIFPVIYRPARWIDEIASLVKDVQTLDLRSGSYTENFQKLVDGLIEAGAGKTTGERPFLRQPTKTRLDVVFSKIPGWAFAWSTGWMIFWSMVFFLLAVFFARERNIGAEDLINFSVVLFSAGVAGFTGGLLAGLFTMLSLRPNAPSISWKHMRPTIRIWSISGPVGILVSGVLTSISIAAGAFSGQGAEPDCRSVGLGECMGRILGSVIGEAIGWLILMVGVFLLFLSAAWFLTGMFAGWLAVRHIRSLEPGITSNQGWKVSAGWGCGALLAAMVMFALLGILSSALRL